MNKPKDKMSIVFEGVVGWMLVIFITFMFGAALSWFAVSFVGWLFL